MKLIKHSKHDEKTKMVRVYRGNLAKRVTSVCFLGREENTHKTVDSNK